MKCFLAHISECDGRIDRAHIGFSKQRLKSIWSEELIKRKYGRPHNGAILELSKDDFANDPRLIQPICRKHHHQLDQLRLKPEQIPVIPEPVMEFAKEFAITDRL